MAQAWPRLELSLQLRLRLFTWCCLEFSSHKFCVRACLLQTSMFNVHVRIFDSKMFGKQCVYTYIYIYIHIGCFVTIVSGCLCQNWGVICCASYVMFQILCFAQHLCHSFRFITFVSGVSGKTWIQDLSTHTCCLRIKFQKTWFRICLVNNVLFVPGAMIEILRVDGYGITAVVLELSRHILLFQSNCFRAFVSELLFQSFCFRTYVSEMLWRILSFQNCHFRTCRFTTEAGRTSELRLGEPVAGGSHLQERPAEPNNATGGTGAAKARYRRIEVIEWEHF